LTTSGALAATFVGTAVFGSGGWRNAAVLLAFFSSSVALSHIGWKTKKKLLDIGKAVPRDAAQVLANGGVATACALAALAGNPVWQVAFAGAFAAAAADTWGTEVGTLAKRAPRSILGWKRVEAGLSGAISAIGTWGELCGALLVAFVDGAATTLTALPLPIPGGN